MGPPAVPLRRWRSSAQLGRIAVRHQALGCALHRDYRGAPPPHNDIFGWVAEGILTVNIGGRYPITQVSDVFAALEARRTTGRFCWFASSAADG